VAGSGSGNVVLVKYDSSGTALWARSTSAGTDSRFNSVAVDASGNVYAAGGQYDSGTYTYGPGVSVAVSASYYNFFMVVLVKYDTNGTALWARSASTDYHSLQSEFQSVAVDTSGYVYAAGRQYGSGTYTYGPGVSVAWIISSGFNTVLVKYLP